MKKLLLILLIAFGLQTQAQISYCDSISYSLQTFSGSTSLTLITTANVPGTVIWDWQVCDVNLCYADSGPLVTFNQFGALDTLKVCYIAIIDVNGSTWTCMGCDSVVYNGFGVWTFLKTTNPLAINEIKYTNLFNNRTYDLLGREINNYNLIPKGTIYIKNREKFIKFEQ
jgi:hypothetical protein|tara:strand:+ start:1110 stop:1619 length:510 start_codon:yes stop_codon:yes gene_type:complete